MVLGSLFFSPFNARFLAKLQGGEEPDMEMHLMTALAQKDPKYMPRNNASPLVRQLYIGRAPCLTMCPFFVRLWAPLLGNIPHISLSHHRAH